MSNLEKLVRQFNEEAHFADQENDREILALLDKYAKRANISHITLAMLSNVFNDEEKTEKQIVMEDRPALNAVEKELLDKKCKLELLKNEIKELENTQTDIATRICEIEGHDYTPWEIDEDAFHDQTYWYHRTCRTCGALEQDYSYESPQVYIKKMK